MADPIEKNSWLVEGEQLVGEKTIGDLAIFLRLRLREPQTMRMYRSEYLNAMFRSKSVAHGY